MEEQFVSEHSIDMGQYSGVGKIKALLTPWATYLILLVVTRLPEVQAALLNFSEKIQVEWVSSIVKFLIGGLPWVAIVLVISSIATLLRSQPFDAIRIYADGIGFLNNGEERKVPHQQTLFAFGKMRQSVWIESEVLGIKNHYYYWSEFSAADVFRSNLERYANWDPVAYRKK